MISLLATPMDWSASIAWIAFFISLIGSIYGPIKTAKLTNEHQLKLREMDIKQQALEKYNDKRHQAINTFISKVGRCLSIANRETVLGLGEHYHCVYQYVPHDLWDTLDDFYMLLIGHNWELANERFPAIVHQLSDILKEVPYTDQSAE